MPRVALLVALLGTAARAGDPACSGPPPSGHHITCPTGKRPVWVCDSAPPCQRGDCDPDEWRWVERCEPIPKK